MFFDTHAHYTDEAFDADRREVLSSVHESGTELIMNAGNDYATSLASMALAREYDWIYAAVGWHPEDADGFDPEKSPELIKTWLKDPKVRAIGEIGLDYHYDEIPRETQRKVFYSQLALASGLGVPVVIHDREAHGDCLEMIRQFPDLTGVFHCFSGSAEMAEELVKMGWYLGFGGVVTFKNSRKALEALEVCPLERILLETDCPYLSPEPNRGKRNDSRNLIYVARKIAEIKGITAEAAAKAALENGRELYGI